MLSHGSCDSMYFTFVVLICLNYGPHMPKIVTPWFTFIKGLGPSTFGIWVSTLGGSNLWLGF
jgi:hypothetical protein